MPTSPAPPSPPPTAALQSALAAEHAAIYAYGTLGALLDDPGQTAARLADDAHRRRRDELIAMVRAAGGPPSPAAGAYRLPEPLTDPAAARRLAVRVEDATAAAYADLLGATDEPGLRRSAVGALQDAAVRAASWRLGPGGPAVTVAFPGREG